MGLAGIIFGLDFEEQKKKKTAPFLAKNLTEIFQWEKITPAKMDSIKHFHCQ